jgi:hypothetical protein
MIRYFMLGAFVATFGSSSFAASEQWKDCSHEIDQYCKGKKSDVDIFECIENREQMGKKKSGLSPKCDEAHERYEKKMGKHEEGEKTRKANSLSHVHSSLSKSSVLMAPCILSRGDFRRIPY